MMRIAHEIDADLLIDLNPLATDCHKEGNRGKREPSNWQCTTQQTHPTCASLGRSFELQSRSSYSQKSSERYQKQGTNTKKNDQM